MQAVMDSNGYSGQICGGFQNVGSTDCPVNRGSIYGFLLRGLEGRIEVAALEPISRYKMISLARLMGKNLSTGLKALKGVLDGGAWE